MITQALGKAKHDFVPKDVVYAGSFRK